MTKKLPEVVIDENYRVTYDGYNLILQEKIKDSKSKKESHKWKVLGYYGSWEHVAIKLFNVFIMDEVKLKETLQLTELLEIIKEVRQTIAQRFALFVIKE